MKKFNEVNIRNLSFPDCDVKKMEFSAEEKTLKVFLDGAWLEEDGGGMLGEGVLSFCNWESLTITLFDSTTKTYSIVESAYAEHLEDICEFKFFDSTICLGGFSENYWMEWKLVNPEMCAAFEPGDRKILMKVSFNEIIEMFDTLIEEKMPREEVSSWASERQRAGDEDNLECDPLNKEEKIWRGILYLLGVDLLDIDGSYLHSIENFIDVRDELIRP